MSEPPRRRIAITGATGLLGTALAAALRRAGDEVIPISRRTVPGGVRWDPEHETLDRAALAGVTAVVHLAGENIGAARWTAERKRALRDTRVGPTAWLARTLATLSPRPRAFVSASATGIYGDQGDAILDERAPAGSDFLATLCAEWEGAAAPAADAGIRVVHPRFGVVLAREGGALPRLLLPFRLGVGGPIGSGRQWFSWIALEDAVGALLRLLEHDELAGAFNVTSPDPVTNRDLARALGRALHRPALLPVPVAALRLVFGEMADGTILASQRVVPSRLLQSGWVPRYPAIAAALGAILRR